MKNFASSWLFTRIINVQDMREYTRNVSERKANRSVALWWGSGIWLARFYDRSVTTGIGHGTTPLEKRLVHSTI